MKQRLLSLLVLAFFLLIAQAMLIFAAPSPTASGASLGDICMQNAAIRRTNGFINALNVFYRQTMTALTERRDAEVAAWDLSRSADNLAALQEASSSFNDSYDNIVQQFYRSNQNVWQIYRSDSQACGNGL